MHPLNIYTASKLNKKNIKKKGKKLELFSVKQIVKCLEGIEDLFGERGRGRNFPRYCKT